MMAFKELAHLPGSARSYTDSSGILIGLAFYYRLRAVADAKKVKLLKSQAHCYFLSLEI
ncbi:MAG: hypothetical protein ACE5I1_14045 [bacterium]